MSDANERAETATTITAEGLDDIESALRSIDDFVDPDEDRFASIVERLEELERVAREAEELLESVDVTELPDAVDEDDLLEAIETGEIPDAIAEGEADEVVNVRRLLRAINLRELLEVGNVVEISQEASELGDAVGDVGDEDDEGAEGEDDDGLVDRAVEEGEALLEEGKDVASEELGSFDPGEGEGIGFDAEDMETYQLLIQDEAMASIEEFRGSLLVVHEKFQRVYDYNREHLGREDTATSSRNPTAASTLPMERADLRATDRFSTVPRQVRHSTAPGFDRIYGSRFERELEKRRRDGDTE